MRVDRVKFAAEMARADVNVKGLMARTGLSSATITAVKTGKSCREDTVRKLAAGLGVNVSEIIEEART